MKVRAAAKKLFFLVVGPLRERGGIKAETPGTFLKLEKKRKNDDH